MLTPQVPVTTHHARAIHLHHKAFSLVELLVVIGIISVLLAVALVAINPSRQFTVTLDAKRQSDVTQIQKALDQYIATRKGLIPSPLLPPGTPRLIARSSGAPEEADLCQYLVDDPFMAALPEDPAQGSDRITNCVTNYNTGYYAIIDSENKIGVYAPSGQTAVAHAGAVPAQFLTPGGAGGVITFVAGVQLPSADSTSTPILADLDGDGKNDLLLGGAFNSTYVFRNTSISGTVSVGTGVHLSGAAQPSRPITVDLDGDGKLDVVVAGDTGGSNAFRNTSTSGTISFAAGVGLTGATAYFGSNAVSGDIDGDGKQDIIVTNKVFRNTSTSGTISFAAPVSLSISGFVYATPLLTDIDGDGKNDLIIPAGSGGSNAYRNTSTSGTISFAAGVNLAGADTYTTPVVSDIDGDGKGDVILSGSSGSSYAYRNTSTSGTISFAAGVNLAGADTYTTPVVSDIDGDGKGDVILGGSYGSTRVYRNTSTSGTISFATGLNLTGSDVQSEAIALADIDGDGKGDIVLGSTSDGTTNAYRNTSTSGTISFAAAIQIIDTDSLTTPRLEDVNADSKKDLILGGGWFTTYLFRNTSTSGTISFDTGTHLTATDSEVQPVYSDIDGDGKGDFVFGGQNGNGHIYRNTSY